MDTKKSLYQLTSDMEAIENQLEENGGELTPELETAMTETNESLLAKTDSYNGLIRYLTDTSANLDTEIKRLQGLKKTYDNSLKNVKKHIVEVMQLFGLDKLEGKFCKFSVASTTSTEVDEVALLKNWLPKIQALQAELPGWLMIEPKISKSELKNEYQGKDMVPEGLSFSENKGLRIR